jgi:glycosyltransferase involved in cell wall biosynthesis
METHDLELTVLMPCLNEAETLEICIKKAMKSLKENNINGEVLIADNGSTDGSQEIAERNGARLINVPIKGYGSALIEGSKQAYGKYIIMGDADDSYDFSDIMPYIEKLREGYELVMGNRFQGGIEKGAMPWSHKYIGTPVLSFIGRLFYKSNIGDFNCGMRGYNKESILKLDLKTTGMEYASEMIVQSTLNKLKIAEVPTTLKKDGRSRPPHLKTFSDGWRHLKFLLMYSPKWLFLIPGIILMVIGLIGSIALMIKTNLQISTNVALGIHSMLYFGAMFVVGFQIIIFSLFAKVYAINSGMHPKKDKITGMIETITLEKGLLFGILLTLIGIGLSIYAIIIWKNKSFGNLDPINIMPITIPSVYLIIVGVQMAFASFILGILNIEYKKIPKTYC